MPHHRIRAHCEKLSEFVRGRIIELKKGGWKNRRIACHMGRSDTAIGRYWQELVDIGKFQRHDGSGRPTATEDPEDRLTVRSAVTAPESSLLSIRRVTRTRDVTCHSCLHTVDPDYNGVWLDQFEIMLTGDVQCLAINSACNCVLMTKKDVSGDAQGSVSILL
ncbi:HTH_Tnp_Tc3_2 domain-containing protein [Trichonephila clavipes]|nr:HTH_Tnp_Tc3_2 domain-containing protein [Trichonephila clavipes]